MATLTPRIGAPLIIQRATSQTLTLPVYSDADVATITEAGSTLSIFDAGWNAVVDAEAVTVDASGFASYALTAAEVPAAEPLSQQWMSVWSLVIGGRTEVFRWDAVLAYQDIRPVLVEQDLLDRHSDLRRLLPADRTSWQPYIDGAWSQIQRRLIKDGRRPELILSAWSLVDVHRDLTLSQIFRDLETYSSGKGRYAELSDQYGKDYADHWGDLQFRFYDEAETGKPADAVQALAEQPLVMLTGRPGWRR